jgi:hypothetical protein
VRLDIRRIGAIKERDEVVGNQTRVKVVKNKVAPPFKQVEFDIMYGEGVSKMGEIIDLGVKAGIVEKSGAWFSYDSQRIGQGRENWPSGCIASAPKLAEARPKQAMVSPCIAMNSQIVSPPRRRRDGRARQGEQVRAEMGDPPGADPLDQPRIGIGGERHRPATPAKARRSAPAGEDVEDDLLDRVDVAHQAAHHQSEGESVADRLAVGERLAQRPSRSKPGTRAGGDIRGEASRAAGSPTRSA